MPWVWPVRRGTITSRLGEARPYGRHEGVDIAPTGRDDLQISPIGPGRVVRTGYMPDGYGYYVVVRHPDGTTSLYGHMSKILVRENETVAPGSTLGIMGSTGMSTGTHLHLTVKDAQGRIIDPLTLPWQGRQFTVQKLPPRSRFSRRDGPPLPPPAKPQFRPQGREGGVVLTRGGPIPPKIKWPDIGLPGIDDVGGTMADLLGLDAYFIKLRIMLPDIIGFIFGLLLFWVGIQATIGKQVVRVAITAASAAA